MKRAAAVILAAMVTATMFAACASDKPAEQSTTAAEQSATEQATEKATEAPEEPYKETHTLYFKDGANGSGATATFFNSVSGKSESVVMKKIGEEKDGNVFTCEGNCAAYNMAYITCGGKETRKFAFNPCVNGWYQSEEDFLPYTQGTTTDYKPKVEEFKLSGYGHEKLIYVWKPDDYDAASSEPYDTVYMLDGQLTLNLNKYGQQLKGCPVADEQVKAMMASTGKKAILVAVDNVGTRDIEMIPKIGVSKDREMMEKMKSQTGSDEDFEFDSMDGDQFADFVANTLVPYIQQHYNVRTDARHTSIAGVSLSGMEAFYIAVEHPEVFGTCGAFSPSFWEFDDATWDKYAKGKKFDDNAAFLFLYTGPEQYDTDPHVTNMYNRLKGLGYPEDKLALHFNEEGLHDGTVWRCMFSEFLTAMVYHRIEPLQP